MNERIKELMGQATEPPEFPADIGYFNPEKFAELIVRKCAEIAYQSLYEDRVFDDTPHNIRGKVMDNIKQHFGVEE